MFIFKLFMVIFILVILFAIFDVIMSFILAISYLIKKRKLKLYREKHSIKPRKKERTNIWNLMMQLKD